MSYYNEFTTSNEFVEFHSDGSFVLDLEKYEHAIDYLDKQLESNKTQIKNVQRNNFKKTA